LGDPFELPFNHRRKNMKKVIITASNGLATAFTAYCNNNDYCINRRVKL